MDEQIISTENIYDGKILRLVKHRVKLADGKESYREVVEHAGAVCVVAMNDKDEVLLVRQFRIATGKALLEIPAGKLEPNEDPEECALRELEEETGFRARKIEPLFKAYTSPGFTDEAITAFVASDLEVTQTNFDEGEAIELSFMPLDEAIGLISTRGIEDMKSVAALLAAKALFGSR